MPCVGGLTFFPLAAAERLHQRLALAAFDDALDTLRDFLLDLLLGHAVILSSSSDRKSARRDRSTSTSSPESRKSLPNDTHCDARPSLTLKPSRRNQSESSASTTRRRSNDAMPILHFTESDRG